MPRGKAANGGEAQIGLRIPGLMHADLLSTSPPRRGMSVGDKAKHHKSSRCLEREVSEAVNITPRMNLGDERSSSAWEDERLRILASRN